MYREGKKQGLSMSATQHSNLDPSGLLCRGPRRLGHWKIQWPVKMPWTLCCFHWVLPHGIHVHGCQPTESLPAPSHTSVSELGIHTGRQLRTLRPSWQYLHPFNLTLVTGLHCCWLPWEGPEAPACMLTARAPQLLETLALTGTGPKHYT